MMTLLMVIDIHEWELYIRKQNFGVGGNLLPAVMIIDDHAAKSCWWSTIPYPLGYGYGEMSWS